MDTVIKWSNAIKTDAGRAAFLDGGIHEVIALLKFASEKEPGSSDLLLRLIRLLRNAIPLGASATSAIIHGRTLDVILRVVVSEGGEPIAEGGSSGNEEQQRPLADSGSSKFAIACAQLLANLSNSGPDGSKETWSNCYPAAFTHLLSHPAAEVRGPATLALYACCRQALSRSEALCGAGHPAPHGLAPGTRPPGDPASGSAASAAARALWLALLSHVAVTPAGSGNQGGPAPQPGSSPRATSTSTSTSTAAGATGAPGEGSEWAALLCGCVALRQGLLRPMLRLLLTAQDGQAEEEAEEEAQQHQHQQPAATGNTSGSEPSEPPAVSPGGSDSELQAGPQPAAPQVPAAGVNPGGSLQRRRCPPGSSLAPVLLHLAAAELLELRGAGEVDLGGWQQQQQQGQERGASGDGSGGGGPVALEVLPAAARPLAAALLCAVEVVEAAARKCGGSGGGSGGSPDTGGGGGAALEAWEGESRKSGATAGPAVAAGPSGPAAVTGSGASAGASACCAVDAGRADPAGVCIAAAGGSGGGGESYCCCKEHAAALLEAAIELLRSLVQREDGCRALAGGVDLAEWLLVEAGVATRLLGPLAALRPAAATRQRAQHRQQQQEKEQEQGQPSAGVATPAGDGGCGPRNDVAAGASAADAGAASASSAATPAPGVGGGRAVVELPPGLAALAAGFPAVAPYVGYRGDLVSVLAGGAFRRPAVAAALVAAGGVELLLAQTHLDDRSPLAREWALWGIRNLCEISPEVQQRIAELYPQGTVETPELRQLGLRIELDKRTGKVTLANTEEAEHLRQRMQRGL